MAPSDETLPIPSRGEPVLRLELQFSVAIYHRGGVEVRRLGEGRSFSVGRADPSDVVIDDRSLSRQHARFQLKDGDPWVADLGSTNGTCIGGHRVTERRLDAGDEVELGQVRCVVVARRPKHPPVHGLAGHDLFLDRVDDAITRAHFFGDELVLAMVRVEAGAGYQHVSAWREQLEKTLRPVDHVALYSGNTLEVLFERCPVDDAVERLRALGDEARVGVMPYPQGATDRAALLDGAQRSLRAACAEQPIVTGAGPEPIAGGSALIAASEAMQSLQHDLERMARAKLPVLLLGETGTGKEVLARAIHEASPRGDGPLVATNCGAIPGQLVESTLFGHVRGAFTGAERDAPGVFGSANGGTVLLDEVGELPPAAQAALLRVLETGKLTPVGAGKEREVDVRVIAATHRDLEAMVAEGDFREDLLYRINALTLRIPPLRERADDVAPLAELFLAHAGDAVGSSSVRSIAPEAMAALERFRWPGNIRELRNVIERACVLAEGETIEVEDLPERLRSGRVSLAAAEAPVADGDLRQRLRDYEVSLIERALEAAGGSTAEAAERLQVPRRTLAHKMKTLGIERG